MSVNSRHSATDENIDSISSKETRNDVLSMYFREIRKFKILNKDEEIELAKAIEENNLSAKQDFIKANLRLVTMIAYRYKIKDSFMPDLIQQGNIALMKAVEKFDYKRDIKFSTYAIWSIRQSIIRWILLNSEIVHVPISIKEKIKKIQKIKQQFLSKNGREPTYQEISEQLNISLDEVHKILQFSIYATSLETSVPDGSGYNLKDSIKDENTISPEDFIDDKNAMQAIFDLIERLPYREQKIIRMKYGLDTGYEYTLTEIGNELNLSREYIRQIHEKLKKMILDALTKKEERQ